MRASVVICSYGRPEAAINLLHELTRQSYEDFETLLVCQGDKKDFEKIKTFVTDRYSLRCYYLPDPNLPHARNIGIKEASGEIVLFLDDDIKPAITLIEAHLANYKDASVAMVGGRILGEPWTEEVADSKIGMVRRFDGYAHMGFHKNIRRSVMHVKATNMSVRREIALEIDGFDERFEGTAEHEELDFCLRVLDKGHRIIFDPDAVIEHFVISTGGCRVKTKEESIYWLYRNHSLVFLNNLNKLFYPVLIIEYLIRIIRRSIIWRNPKVIISAWRGIRDGWKAHVMQASRKNIITG
ncbi:MAG: glycosyltransferase [Candidatus Omnitrophota bacterium]